LIAAAFLRRTSGHHPTAEGPRHARSRHHTPSPAAVLLQGAVLSPDDDLSKALFDPREDEDPDFDPNANPDQLPHPYPHSAEAVVLIPALEADGDETAVQNDDNCVHVMTVQGSVCRPLHPQSARCFPDPAATQPPFPASVIATSNDEAAPPLRR
jgi:hypothetical protein